MSYLDDVIVQVRAWDADRPRSRQSSLGWSEMSGCRAYMGFRLRGEWASDDDDNWRAIAGTALHEFLTGVRREAAQRKGRNVVFDVPVTYRGVPGKADEVDLDLGVVTDYKFPSKASSRLWDDPDLQEERFVQPHGYAAGLVFGGAEQDVVAQACAALDPGQLTVQVLVAPVDGTFEDWRTYTQPFDRVAADEAVDRYQAVLEGVAAGGPLPRDKPWFFCERFCEFFTACRGGTPRPDLEEIHDPELATAVERYGLASEQERAAAKVKSELAPLIKGLRGTARGWRVTMTREGKSSEVPDPEAVALYYALHGDPVPTVTKPGRAAYLRVEREKK